MLFFSFRFIFFYSKMNSERFLIYVNISWITKDIRFNCASRLQYYVLTNDYIIFCMCVWVCARCSILDTLRVTRLCMNWEFCLEIMIGDVQYAEIPIKHCHISKNAIYLCSLSNIVFDLSSWNRNAMNIIGSMQLIIKCDRYTQVISWPVSMWVHSLHEYVVNRES